MATKKIAVLGSTGSIGTQALSLVDDLSIEVTAISGYRNTELLEEQALRFNPEFVCAVDKAAASDLKVKLAHKNIKVLEGEEGLLEIASSDSADTLLNSVVGIAGLAPTLMAIESGKNIALANKETLVAGGKIVTAEVAKSGVELLPVDSEHSAIFQCINGSRQSEVQKIFLTASGGPFFGFDRAKLSNVAIEDALKHPNWSMGKKITIDSATMMNKGLEFIEAMWLFSLSPDQIEIVIHRQSIVHSMVEFCDNSVIAQLGLPDMRIPIQYALTYPERKPNKTERLTVDRMSSLTFEKPDYDNFLCLTASLEAVKKGGLAPAAANAANERAVKLFLKGEISFLDIGEIVLRAVESVIDKANYTLEDIFEADRAARLVADEYK